MKEQSLLELWLSSPTISDQDRKIISSWSEDTKQKHFQKIIQFGTGFRAPIGLGSNFFNRYNIQVLALALAQIWSQIPDSKTVKILIFRDHRHQSLATSEWLAKVLQQFNIQPFFFTKNIPVPTPFLSFVLSHSQQFAGGIMITASHSPQQINGIKLFNSSGYPWNETENTRLNQLLKTHYSSFLNTKINLTQNQTISEISREWKNKYLESILKTIQITNNTPDPTFDRSQMQILFSPLHGSGSGWTDQLLTKAGYQVALVPSQTELDPNFSTIIEPNPEKDETFQMAKNLSSPANTDLIILNDGDADRVRAACYVENKLHIFSGNEIALLFIYFLFSERNKTGTIYCSYVSTPLVEQIAHDFNSSVVRTATGFGNLANHYSQTSNQHFLLAFEESIGFLLDLSINHDKDGLQSALLLAEINYFCLTKNTNLFNYLQTIYQKYGYCYTQTHTYLNAAEVDFAHKYQFLQPKDAIGNFTLRRKKNLFSNNKMISSLFFLFFDHHCSIAIRNSQTEPVGKVYFFVWEHPLLAQKHITKLFSFLQNEWKFSFLTPSQLK